MRQMKIKGWALGLAFLAAGSSQAGVTLTVQAGDSAAQTQEKQQPRAMSQYKGRFAAFAEAREKAVRAAGSRIDDTFVAHWFGPATLTQASTPAIEFRDEAGLHSIAYERDSAGWARKATLVSAQQLETVPMGSSDTATRVQSTLVRPPSAR